MDVQNIRFINEKPYRVSWKADGTRLGGVKGNGVTTLGESGMVTRKVEGIMTKKKESAC